MAQTYGVDYWNQETRLYCKAHPRLRFMANVLRELPQQGLLDIGCAGATLRDLLPSSFNYFGCDITDRASERLPPGHFIRQDLNASHDLAFFDERGIDVIHIGGVLEYLHEPGAVLEEARRLLKPGQPLLVSMIHFQGQRYAVEESHHPSWVYKPRLEEFLHLVQESGWKLDRLWPFSDKDGWKGSWYRLWSRLLGAKHAWTRRHARQFILLARAA